MNQRNLSVGRLEPCRNESAHIDHISHAQSGIKVFHDKLHIICVISNPHRFRMRYELYRSFEKNMEESGVVLYTTECAFGDRSFEVTDTNNPYHIQLRTPHELWLKENLINLAMQRIPSEVKYIGWIDSDLTFIRPDWAQETLHQLQHYDFVQLFTHIINVDSKCHPVSTYYNVGFVYSWRNNIVVNPAVSGKTSTYNATAKDQWYGPPGGAWAAKRSSIDAVGGIPDIGILGSGDTYFATGLIGELNQFLRSDFSEGYKKYFLDWEKEAVRTVRKNIGYVDGTIIHNYHGSMKSRQYYDRNQILVENKFTPNDIKKDSQGLWQLRDIGNQRSIDLKDRIRRYFQARNEDMPSE